MAQIMSHARWMRLTDGGRLSRRSSKLKSIDRALAAYHKTPLSSNLELLKKAMVQWMQDKEDWTKSIRNKKGAAEALYKQINELDGVGRKKVPAIRIDTPEGPVTWTGEDAEKFVEEQREQIVQLLFSGKQLEWRTEYMKRLASQGQDAIVESGSLLSGTKTLVKAYRKPNPDSTTSKIAKSLMDTLVPKKLLVKVTKMLNKLIPNFARELAISMTPIAGVLASGGSAAASLVKTTFAVTRAKDGYTAALVAFKLDGAPGDAVEAMMKILDRELNYQLTNLSVNTTAFGAKMAALAAGDPAVANAAAGVGAAVLKLTNIIRIIVRDCEEQEKANDLMRSGNVDIKVFEVCPIIGAYYVALAPHSALINILASEWGEFGWMDDTEILVKKHIRPLQDQAVRVIRGHRFVIPQLQKHAALTKVNKKALERMKEKAKTAPSKGISSESRKLKRTNAKRNLFDA